MAYDSVYDTSLGYMNCAWLDVKLTVLKFFFRCCKKRYTVAQNTVYMPPQVSDQLS